MHFYGGLYEYPQRPEYDPILNWILKTEDRFVRFDETTRHALVRDHVQEPMDGLEIEGYTGYIAYLEPEYAADLRQESRVRLGTTTQSDLSAQDYYLPWALRENGWRVVPSMPGQDSVEGILLERREGGVTRDQLWLDPKREFAMLKRQIKWPDEKSAHSLQLEYRELEAVSEELWLPRQILVRAPDRSFFVKVNVIQVNRVPTDVFGGKLPAGTIVTDLQKHRQYVLPGGEDLLDFTIERVRYFLEQSAGHVSLGDRSLPNWRALMAFGLAAMLAVVLFAKLTRRTNSRTRAQSDAVTTAAAK